MIFDDKESRATLKEGTVLTLKKPDGSSPAVQAVIDQFLAAGGFALMYLCHIEDEPGQYYALKEFYPHCIEDAAAGRRASDGRIVLYNPLFENIETIGAEENEKRMAEVLPFFSREVRMAKKSGLVYDDGSVKRQNSADVLSVKGPYVSGEGNTYLLINTFDGFSLRDYIDSGWENEEDRGVVPNSRTEGLIGLMEELADELTDLHGNKRIFHLDLSPTNIYLIRRRGGRALHPSIIDWGSAYDRDDRAEAAGHRFTSNAFSAPEIHTLAGLREPDAGYPIDETTDTFALVNILFYACTGSAYRRPETAFCHSPGDTGRKRADKTVRRAERSARILPQSFRTDPLHGFG